MTKMKRGKARSRTIARHRAHVHGPGVFDRRFFEETLLGLVETCPKPSGTKPVVTVFLGDGSQLDCCGVVLLEERYCVLAAYEGVGEDGLPRTADDIGFETVPYELIIRCSVRAETRPVRLGFGEALPR